MGRRTIALLLCCIAAAAAKDEDTILAKLSSIGADTDGKRAVVGGLGGFISGMMVKKAQDTILTCMLLGGGAAAASCYLGWVKPDDIEAAAAEALKKVESSAPWSLFAEAAPQVDVQKTKVMLSNIYKRAPGVLAGGATGALLGYRLG